MAINLVLIGLLVLLVLVIVVGLITRISLFKMGCMILAIAGLYFLVVCLIHLIGIME